VHVTSRPQYIVTGHCRLPLLGLAFPLIFVRGHFQEIGIAALLLGLKPRHVEKFRECQLTDVEESELTEEKEETCAKHKIAFAEWAI